MHTVTLTWKKRISKKRREAIAEEISKRHLCVTMNGHKCLTIATGVFEYWPVMMYLFTDYWTDIN